MSNAAVPADTGDHFERAKILAVDDEPAVELLFKQMFRSAIRENRFELLFARDGQEALDVLRETPDVDLVLTDINMPRMDGLTLLSHLEDVNPMLKAVVVSAYGDMKNIRVAMNRGAFDFITKPVDEEDLKATVNKTIREVNRIRELMRQRDAAAAADQTKSDFIAMVSQEVRTPMNAMYSMAQFLLDTRLSPEQHEYAETIANSGEIMLSLLNDVLDLSKIEAGKLELESVGFDGRDLIEGVANLMGSHAREKGLEIVTQVSSDVPAQLQGDPERLRQLLMNLLSNAIKFTDEGSVAVRETMDSTVENEADEDREWLRVEVEDTGIGLAEAQQFEVFEAFTQADVSTTRRYGGTGLGLSICHRLIDMMGGKIGVQSQLGKGSTFWFSIPLPQTDQSSSVPAPDLNGLRVTLIADTTPLIDCVRGYLEDAGATVSGDSGAELADVVGAGDSVTDADIVLVDHLALKHWGQDASDRLADAPPILLLTPREYDLAHQAELQSFFSGEVRKPIRRLALLNTVAVAAGRDPHENGVSGQSDSATLKFAGPEEDEARAAGCLVLVAEDNPTNQFVIKKLLTRLGIAFQMVEDGQSAWEALQSGNGYGLLLTDCHMPAMDGYDLSREIRESEGAGKARLPIIALTADALRGTAERCLEAGMDDYLSKPVTLTRLDAAISQWLPRAIELRSAKPAKSIDDEDVAETPVVAAGGDSESASKSSESGTSTALDPAELREMYGEIDDDVRELLRIFVETTKPMIDQLGDALDQPAIVEAAELAHATKGSAYHAAAPELAAITKDIENSLDAARRRKRDIAAAWDRVEDAISKL